MDPIARRRLLTGTATFALATVSGIRCATAQPGTSTGAQWQPQRPIRLVVPFSAGGTTDLLGRIVAQGLSDRLGQPVVVDNRPGAGGNVGADAVAKAEPDGLTLLMTTIGTAAINPSLYKDAPFKPEDLIAVAEVARVPNVIVAAPDLPARTLREMVELAKRRRQGLTIGSSGIGTSLHLTGEILQEAADIELIHVPFRGSSSMLPEIMAGRVDTGVDNLPSALPHIRDGRLRALAVTGDHRSSVLPDVPTTAEAGFPAVDPTAWFGVQAPAGTPQPVINRLATEIRGVLQDPTARARIEELGAVPSDTTPALFQAFINRETARWGDVIQRNDITVQ
ncbi:Bug family tripartite tricarboxylate transporter substrate binding protein [Falsiroseomonas tokyonensis]|uniref:Bug family tripartite tricarboxylate transporter substrate binding protein n=1 Tax=Falsiroseomonas tokyonensis TaxID=430521 RepID=A0ABV7BM20_9PROT|nr:tripartite tricarboxylate transporter substrate binding protein [Falsiroseomonas tokyonensis]MBU8536595.1 tripartite tricarboxylate transporter substrate binding protein [Falsiroseomonas tokyonensis]